MSRYFCLFPLIFLSTLALAEPAPGLLLANIYHQDTQLRDYWVSEKLDGVRAYWDGNQLISRQGNIYPAPTWFTEPLPDFPLDGELWLGRGKFAQLSGRVRRQGPTDADWQDIKYMIFDLPGSDETFDNRLKRLQQIIPAINAAHIQLVQQFKVSDHQELMKKLDTIVQQGGEGLMLHRGSSKYFNGRSDDLLKLKTHLDAEATVINHIPGSGKYEGILGSLLVETADKKRFRIGTGFSDEERKNPPAIGSLITFKYYGLTENGIPRFASFVRVRDDY